MSRTSPQRLSCVGAIAWITTGELHSIGSPAHPTSSAMLEVRNRGRALREVLTRLKRLSITQISPVRRLLLIPGNNRRRVTLHPRAPRSPVYLARIDVGRLSCPLVRLGDRSAFLYMRYAGIQRAAKVSSNFALADGIHARRCDL